MCSWLQRFLPLLLSLALTRALPASLIPHEGETFEGDIIVSKPLKDYMAGTASEKREYHEDTVKWAKVGNVVKIPYTRSGLDTETENNLKLAFQAFKGQTCVEFVPRSDESNYIQFTNGNGCLSPIGLQNNGPQQISLGSGCGTLPTILHEMMHAIGFLHEQSREDRDEYVAVQYANIDPDFQKQFLTYSVQNLGYPYDKKSLMHYKNTEFTVNGQRTIQSLADPDELLGNDKFFTKTDVKQINTLYNCPSRFLQLHDYEITIYTSDEWWAGTGSTVYLEIKGDDLDSSGEFKAGTGFDEDSHLKIERFFPDMALQKLSVRHDNTGWGAAWHLQKIVIKDKTTGTSFSFECNCWIEGVNAKIVTR